VAEGRVAVHVDDMAIFTSNIDGKLKEGLCKEFMIMDMGELKHIVGLEVTRNIEEGTLKISQTQYITKILDRFGMSKSTPVSMPLNPNTKLIKTPDEKLRTHPQRFKEQLTTATHGDLYK
jgi:hypothetical protein